jgi:uncharacterized ubiquitin-like protein YukD
MATRGKKGGNSLSEIENYAILTAQHESFGTLDIRVSRDIPVKEIILGLFDALSRGKKVPKGCYAKADVAQVLLSPTDTLRSQNIYDGDILRIL